MSYRTADQLGKLVRQICKMDMTYLSDTIDAQNTAIYDFMSLAMHNLAKLANQVNITDKALVTADGNVSFKVAGGNVMDMFQPLRLIDVDTGTEVRRRNAYTFEDGWYWEGAIDTLHVKGVAGNIELHYIKYPAWVASGGQVPEFPPSGYYTLVYETAALIKQTKNFYEEAGAMKQHAMAGYGPVAEASAVPLTGAGRPQVLDVKKARG